MPVPVQIRLNTPADAFALSLIASASFLEAFAGILSGPDILAHVRQNNSPEKFLSWLENPTHRAATAELEGAPVGYAVLCPPELPVPLTASDLELKRIYLLHRFQGSGSGAALMQWAIAKAQAMGKTRLLLGVYGGNHSAIAFYKHQGFAIIGTRQFLVGSTLHDDFVLAREV